MKWATGIGIILLGLAFGIASKLGYFEVMNRDNCIERGGSFNTASGDCTLPTQQGDTG